MCAHVVRDALAQKSALAGRFFDELERGFARCDHAAGRPAAYFIRASEVERGSEDVDLAQRKRREKEREHERRTIGTIDRFRLACLARASSELRIIDVSMFVRMCLEHVVNAVGIWMRLNWP